MTVAGVFTFLLLNGKNVLKQLIYNLFIPCTYEFTFLTSGTTPGLEKTSDSVETAYLTYE